MRTSHYRYPVRLSEEQRRWLETMVRMSTTPAKHYLVVRVLLMSDQCQGKPSHTDGQIAEVLDISRRTVIRIKQRFVQENMEVALTGSFPRERPERRCLPREKPNSFIWRVARLPMGGYAGRWNCSLTGWCAWSMSSISALKR